MAECSGLKGKKERQKKYWVDFRSSQCRNLTLVARWSMRLVLISLGMRGQEGTVSRHTGNSETGRCSGFWR